MVISQVLPSLERLAKCWLRMYQHIVIKKKSGVDVVHLVLHTLHGKQVFMLPCFYTISHAKWNHKTKRIDLYRLWYFKLVRSSVILSHKILSPSLTAFIIYKQVSIMNNHLLLDIILLTCRMWVWWSSERLSVMALYCQLTRPWSQIRMLCYMQDRYPNPNHRATILYYQSLHYNGSTSHSRLQSVWWPCHNKWICLWRVYTQIWPTCVLWQCCRITLLSVL